ncbi:MAG: hypothetical protein WAZ19_07470 [Anaerolineae bacterium]
MKNLKVVRIGVEQLEFDNGMILKSYHERDCCESHYLSMADLTMDDFKGLLFDLSNDDFFERIDDYGIALNPKNGHPVRIPGYGANNGYYSSNLSLVITRTNGKGYFKKYDIEECQKIDY